MAPFCLTQMDGPILTQDHLTQMDGPILTAKDGVEEYFLIVSRIAIQFYREVWNEETGDIDHGDQSVDGST